MATTRRAGRSDACAECGMIRHQADSTCSRRGRAKTPAGKARSRPADLPSNGARETARTLLGQLVALRAKLDARIETVRELAEIL